MTYGVAHCESGVDDVDEEDTRPSREDHDDETDILTNRSDVWPRKTVLYSGLRPSDGPDERRAHTSRPLLNCSCLFFRGVRVRVRANFIVCSVWCPDPGGLIHWNPSPRLGWSAPQQQQGDQVKRECSVTQMSLIWHPPKVSRGELHTPPPAIAA